MADQQGELPGSFLKTDFPGEYGLSLVAPGRTPTARRWIICRPREPSSSSTGTRPNGPPQAADHAFLKRLANAGDGKAFQADGFKQFLRDLATQPLARGRPSATWPEWRRAAFANDERTGKRSLSSGILLCYGFFLVCLCLEWLLRRL